MSLDEIKAHLRRQRNASKVRIVGDYVTCTVTNTLSDGTTCRRRLKYNKEGTLVGSQEVNV